MTSPALASIAGLRRLAAALVDGDDDARWLASRLRNYFADAPRGLTVDMAFDLAPMPGTNAWWTDLAIETRDAALRTMAIRFWPDRGVASQAYQIERRASRYAASSWRFDRERSDMPECYVGTDMECLWRAFASGATMPLSKRQLQTILAADTCSDAA